jgi:transposase
MAKVHFISYTPNQLVLFPQRIDKDIAENDPVRIISGIIDGLKLDNIQKLYKEAGRSPYHPRMMLKVIIYAYMNNIYSCRRIEKLLRRDIHFIWLAGYEKPDFITINRFRNRVKKEINGIFTRIVLLLAEKGFITLDTKYVDGTKIEAKSNKYTFVWRKTVERNRAKLMEKISVLLEQIDDSIVHDQTDRDEPAEFTPSMLEGLVSELQASIDKTAVPENKDQKAEKGRRKDSCASSGPTGTS